ncbi:MAG TPA: cupin domain-containing protein [Bacteroidales bacterium]|nr:cupin domain-containing protein [Bacteroidales bacterium]
MEQNNFPKSKALQPETQIEYQNGSIVSKTIVKKEKGNITLFAFDKNQALSEHTAPFDALISVIDGKAEVIIGGNPNVVEAGQMILMPANIPHAVNAIEKFKMMLVMVKE